jgi:DNA-binding SARP family transcriptional activator/tetratricopeptide (TPR) repeat protein
VTYQAKFLGTPAFYSDGKEMSFPFLKARILALLLVEEGTMHRDRASSLLWGDKTTDAGRRNLSNALSAIRNLAPVFISRGRSIGLDPKVKIEKDLDLLKKVDQLPWEDLECLCRPYLDLPELDDWPVFNEWLRDRRSRYRKMLAEGIKKRADLMRSKGADAAFQDAVRCFEKLAELEPYDEDIHGELAHLYIKADRKIDAVRVARNFSRRVEEDLGVQSNLEEVLSGDRQARRVKGSKIRTKLAEDNPLLRNSEVLKLLDFFCRGDNADKSLCGFVWGEEGIGKGTLLNEVKNRLENNGWTCLTVRCYQEEMARPMAPFLHLLRRLGCRLPDDENLSPTDLTYFRVAERILEHLASRGPEDQRILVIENLQWMDKASWMILESIIWNESFSRKLLISGYEEVRSTFMLRTEIAGEPIETLEIHLDRFDLEQTGQICRHLRPDLVWSEQRVAEVYSQTQGTPFFIRQLLTPQEEIPESAFEGDTYFPQTTNLFETRIEMLDGDDRLFLEGLAVFPEPATLSQITDLLDLSGIDVSTRLEQVELQGLLREHPEEGGEILYYFAHPKIREALLEKMQPTRRAALIGKAVEILEQQFSDGEEDGTAFARIAELCRKGGLRYKEILWRIRELKVHFKTSHEVFPSLTDQELKRHVPMAEDTDFTKYSISEVRSLLDRQVRHYGHTPEYNALERELLVLEGAYLWWSGRYDEALETLSEAYRRARKGNADEQVEVLQQLCYLAIQTDDVTRLFPFAREMYRLALGHRSFVAMGTALRFLAIAQIMNTRPEVASKLLRMSTKVFEKIEEQGPGYTLPLIAAEHFRGDILMAEGDRTGALELYKNCVRMGESLGIHRGMGLSLAKSGYCLCLLGEFEEAEKMLRRLEGFYFQLNSDQDGGLQGGGIAFSLLALIAGLKGDWAKSREYFEITERLLSQARRPTWLAIYYWAKAELVKSGRSIPADFVSAVLGEEEAHYRNKVAQLGSRVGWIH